jgi:hypothetical protein
MSLTHPYPCPPFWLSVHKEQPHSGGPLRLAISTCRCVTAINVYASIRNHFGKRVVRDVRLDMDPFTGELAWPRTGYVDFVSAESALVALDAYRRWNPRYSRPKLVGLPKRNPCSKKDKDQLLHAHL